MGIRVHCALALVSFGACSDPSAAHSVPVDPGKAVECITTLRALESATTSANAMGTALGVMGTTCLQALLLDADYWLETARVSGAAECGAYTVGTATCDASGCTFDGFGCESLYYAGVGTGYVTTTSGMIEVAMDTSGWDRAHRREWSFDAAVITAAGLDGSLRLVGANRPHSIGSAIDDWDVAITFGAVALADGCPTSGTMEILTSFRGTWYAGVLQLDDATCP